LRTSVSSSASGAIFVVVGLLIGAGLVLATTYANGEPKASTITATQLETVDTATQTFVVTTVSTIATVTVTTTQSSEFTATTASISLGAASCTDTIDTVCTMAWTNTGNANTQALAACSVSFGGSTYSGAITGAPVNLASGGSGSLTCTATNPVALQAGEAVSGSVSLENGGSALFSGSG